MTYGRLAQLVEHLLDVQEVTGSSPVPSTKQFVLEPGFLRKRVRVRFFVYRRFAFATATNTPVGCLSNRTVCVSRWRGFAPTSSATRVRRAVSKQRQGIIVVMVSCLLLCGIKFALCELGRHIRDVLSLAGMVYSA